MPCAAMRSTRPPVAVVTLRYASGGEAAQQLVSFPFAFRFEVPPGQYALVSNIGRLVPVSVSAGQTAEANLTDLCI